MASVAPLLPTIPASPTAFTIKVNWEASAATAPGGFTSDVVAAIRYVESQFSDAMTLTIDVGYNEFDGQKLGADDLGESGSFLKPVSYANLRAALITDTKTPTDASAVGSLTGSSPLNYANYWVTTAQAKALALPVTNNGSGVDGFVGFGPASEFTYGDTATGGRVAAGTYDFFATAVHEITEVMGRQLLTGQAFGGISNSFTLLDLFHFAAPNTRDFAASIPGYFSVNNGVTNLGEFNTISSGDAGDWASSVTDNPFDAFATPGVPQPVTSDDLAEMDAIGWDPTASISTRPFTQPNGTPTTTPSGTPSGTPFGTPSGAPPGPVTNPLVPVNDPIAPSSSSAARTAAAPAGITFAFETQYLADGQGCGVLSAGTPIAAAAQFGKPAGDAFSYALSGGGAGSFNLISGSGGALLTAGPGGVAGAAGGALYALTVTATDQTAAGKLPASGPVNVVVGDNGNDTINLASLPGIAAAAPTFIYGLRGNDIINSAAMSGVLYFDVGTGYDILSGGSGTNVFEFGAGAAESAMDIITNFNAAVDLIDLKWVGWRFSGMAALDPSATTISAASIGWQTSGGNTFVYANTDNWPETLAAANMKIELQGDIPLTTANFVHG